jgi:hypothetical protein
VTLGDEPVHLEGEMEGVVETDGWRITFPVEGAVFRWPYDPYNPYDVEKHRSPRNMYVSLLTLPVGAECVEVQIRVQ